MLGGVKASVRIGNTLDASSFQQARHKNSPDRSQGYKENAKETERLLPRLELFNATVRHKLPRPSSHRKEGLCLRKCRI